MKLHDWQYRDPGELIGLVAAQVRLRPGDVYLVLVAHPSTEQRIERIQLLQLDLEQDDYAHAERELERVLEHWPIPDVHPRTHGVVTVVVRTGLTVLGASELGWICAWRYCRHGRSCYDADLILVTEHGWLDWATEWGASLPTCIAS